MSNYYDPKKILEPNLTPFEKENDWVDKYDVLQEMEPTVFHLYSLNPKHLANTIQCKYCLGIQFNIGRADYATYIRCVNCEYEIEITN